MVSHVKYICHITYYHLRNIASIRSRLTQKAVVRLMYSLVISIIDFANCLLHGIPDCLINKMQRVHNAAAGLVVRCHRWDHITLPSEMKTISGLVTFKILLKRISSVLHAGKHHEYHLFIFIYLLVQYLIIFNNETTHSFRNCATDVSCSTRTGTNLHN